MDYMGQVKIIMAEDEKLYIFSYFLLLQA